MSDLQFAHKTRITFSTDATRANAQIVPLGYMLEGVWNGGFRWLGLIGRTRLTPAELDRINLSTWPELARRPFDFLVQMFSEGWAADWGEAGSHLQTKWMRSPVGVEVSNHGGALGPYEFNPNDLASSGNALLAKLGRFIPDLAPMISAAVVPLRREIPIEVVEQLNEKRAA